MCSQPVNELPLRQYASHPRDWRENLYVYPVISRRSGGLSIGINLNPDAACNFDCIYCQVDRTVAPRTREVNVVRLEEELSAMIASVSSGGLFGEPEFADVPESLRRPQDFAFSGDGEPTACPQFLESVKLVARMKRDAHWDETKIVLITDACYLIRPNVEAGLTILDEHHGEIWAKLDAGTEDYYRRVNRPNYPLGHVLDNILAVARRRPIVIQSLFMRIDGVGPGDGELAAFADRLHEIAQAGGGIKLVQIYTIARRPASASVAPLSNAEVDRIVELVRERTGLHAEPYYGHA